MRLPVVRPWRIRLYHGFMRVAARVRALPARMVPPPFRLMEMGTAFWQSRALYVAARLGLADVLADAERPVEDIAVELELEPGHLYRLMRMLAAHDVFEETAPGVFRNSRVSRYLRREHPASVRDLVLMHNSPEMIAPWVEGLEASIRDGGVPFEKVHGRDLFGYMDEHPAFDALFARAMDAVDAVTGEQFLADIDWGRFARVIDVGGSRGAKAAAMLRAHPGLRAVVFDRAQVVAQARTDACERLGADVCARLEYRAGDMFEALPPAESDDDAYVFIAVFHGLSDDEARHILRNLRRALGAYRPTVLIGDAVVAERGIDPVLATFDLQMLIGTRGRERTRREWRALLASEGFGLEDVMDVRSFAKFVIVRPS